MNLKILFTCSRKENLADMSAEFDMVADIVFSMSER